MRSSAADGIIARAMTDPRFSCISYSLRRTFDAGELDLDGYFALCRDLGMAALDPWGPHLSGLRDLSKSAFEGGEVELDDADTAYLDRVRDAAEAVGLPFGCVAPDGPTYVYDPDAANRDVCRRLAKRWIDAGGRLGVRQMRFDPGLFREANVPDDVMALILAGYRDLVDYGRGRGVEIVIENHWGCAAYPAVIEHILDRVDGLGYLFDSFNFAPGTQADGWRRLAGRATATHVKCLDWADDGEELTQHLGHAVRLVRDGGYAGIWGIESTPRDPSAVSEREGIERTMALIGRWL